MRLVTGLRPSSLLVVLGFRILDALALDHRVRREDEDARRVRVGQERQVSRILVDDAGERIEVRMVGDVEVVRVDRRGQRDRFEQIRSAAREQRQTIHRSVDARYKIANFRGVLLETVALGPFRRIRLDPLRQLLAEERCEPIAPVLVGLKVEIQADDGEGRGIHRRQTIELPRELLGGWHTRWPTNARANESRESVIESEGRSRETVVESRVSSQSDYGLPTRLLTTDSRLPTTD